MSDRSNRQSALVLLCSLLAAGPLRAEPPRANVLGVALQSNAAAPRVAVADQLRWIPPGVDVAVTVDVEQARRVVDADSLQSLLANWVDLADRQVLDRVRRVCVGSLLRPQHEVEAIAIVETDVTAETLVTLAADKVRQTGTNPDPRTWSFGGFNVCDLTTRAGYELSISRIAPGLVMFAHHPRGVARLLGKALRGDGRNPGNWILDGDLALSRSGLMSCRVAAPTRLELYTLLKGKGWEHFNSLHADVFPDGDRYVVHVDARMNNIGAWALAEGKINRAIQAFATDPASQALPRRLLDIIQTLQFRTHGMSLIATTDVYPSDVSLLLTHFTQKAQMIP